MAKKAHKAEKKKKERFKKEYPLGRKAFSQSKRAIGLKRGQATQHSVIFKKLSANVPR